MSHLVDAEQIPSEAEVIAGLPFEELDRRLRAAVRMIRKSDRVMAFLLVQMEGERVYLSTGHRSMADYAEAHLGIDRQRAVELLRVGRMLCERPELDRAFGAGRIGWARVRALAGVHDSISWRERSLN